MPANPCINFRREIEIERAFVSGSSGSRFIVLAELVHIARDTVFDAPVLGTLDAHPDKLVRTAYPTFSASNVQMAE